ncbi:hemolysin [Pelistega indica]|uniref:Hemolysin n=1 Tax=Pelistega indica TaxID=1414851 RepID=V8G1Q5_9BURK|nr:BON domain-containing protein [Pelistega indica]ETD69893.1 hemolysin [Pelistega indica]
MSMFLKPTIISALLATSLLSGCVTSLVLGGAAATGVVVSDRRSGGQQLTDTTISATVENRAGGQLTADSSRVNATTFNQRVLITGEVATAADKDKVTQIARGVKDVKDVVNELMISKPADFSTRTRDSWITSKVRSELVITKGIPSRTISITTSQGVVYLMGQVTNTEGNLAANAAAGIDGVVRVVKVFDYITDTAPKAVNHSNTSATTSTPSNTSSSGVVTTPLQ